MSKKWHAPWLTGPLPKPKVDDTPQLIAALKDELERLEEIHRDMPSYVPVRREQIAFRLWELEQKQLAARAAGGERE